MLTAKAAGLLLGLSARKVYDLAAAGRLPCYRYDSAVRFDEVDVIAFRAASKIEALRPESTVPLGMPGLTAPTAAGLKLKKFFSVRRAESKTR